VKNCSLRCVYDDDDDADNNYDTMTMTVMTMIMMAMMTMTTMTMTVTMTVTTYLDFAGLCPSSLLQVIEGHTRRHDISISTMLSISFGVRASSSE